MKSGEPKDFQPQPLICQNSQKPAVQLCTTESCRSYPVMCNDLECQCQAPHEEHLTVKLKGVIHKIEKADVAPEDDHEAKIIAGKIFEEITQKLNQARSRVDQELIRNKGTKSKHDDLKSWLLGKNSLNKVTGTMVNEMLR